MLRLLVFLACFAAVVYAVFWLIDRRSKPTGGSGGKTVPRGPIGPDDDEDFLRGLDRKRRHSKGPQPKDEGPQTT
ncbi:MAG: hypothetical protein ABIN79_11550 [Marmoricola sp.]